MHIFNIVQYGGNDLPWPSRSALSSAPSSSLYLFLFVSCLSTWVLWKYVARLLFSCRSSFLLSPSSSPPPPPLPSFLILFCSLSFQYSILFSLCFSLSILFSVCHERNMNKKPFSNTGRKECSFSKPILTFSLLCRKDKWDKVKHGEKLVKNA